MPSARQRLAYRLTSPSDTRRSARLSCGDPRRCYLAATMKPATLHDDVQSLGADAPERSNARPTDS